MVTWEENQVDIRPRKLEGQILSHKKHHLKNLNKLLIISLTLNINLK